MKISPLGPMSTIAPQSLGGVALNGAETPTAQPISPHRIKMKVSRTPEQLMAEPPQEEAAETKPEIGILDNNAQANDGSEVTQPLSPQLAAIAKQRRALQLREQQLAEKEKALQTQGQGMTRAEIEAKIKAGALRFMQEFGGVPQEQIYSQLTDEILQNQNGMTPEAQRDAQAAALKEQLQKDIESKFAEKDTAQEQAVFAQIKRNIDKLSFSSDKFKVIRESKSQGDVEELIRRTWKESGEVLDEEEAMESVEKELREDAKRFAKLLEELEPTTPAPAAQAAKPAIKTLTNKDTAKPLMNRRQRAIAAALNQLPKG